MNIEVFNELHKYLLNVIPDFYIKHGELGCSKFVDHEFTLMDINFKVTCDVLNETQFFSVNMLNEGKTKFCNLISIAHHIKIQNNCGQITSNEKEVLPEVVTCSSMARLYRYNNKIIFNREVQDVPEITKDVIFNLSTYLDDTKLEAYKFMTYISTPFNYIYINLEHNTEWYAT